ncbi:MAG TPA: amino acid permease [Steroidobacteraceae bacterium]|jgi:basic amino acid/polyamine antiporter, APA family|nr:amino acid permease [Steroidobacteraceae bacterium]
MSLLRRLFAVRPVEAIVAELNSAPALKRVLTASSLTAIGLGSTIGTGIFILTGTVAANHTGPALTLALLIAALGSALAAICYSEFAAMIPVSGSAYTYAYCTLGESVAWIIGWNLSLEYLMSASAVAVGWSQYVVNLLRDWGIHLPAALTNAPLDKGADSFLVLTGSFINLPAVLVTLGLGWVLYIGIKESATANNIMVWMKVAVIVIFILAGISYVDTANWHPYLPPNTGKDGEFGVSGLLRGTAIIFFSYVGFDAASTAARETRNPQRDVPLGILGALVISAILYVAMSAVMTGMVPYQKLGADAPVAVALDAHPQLAWLGSLVKIGAIAGMTSVILMSMLGQPRIFLAMADDGLLPPSMRKVHPKYRTPHVATAITTVLAAAIAGLFPLNILGELISMGILLAFTGVCIGVLVLRYTRPNLTRPFRVPFAAVTCVLGAVICGGITYFLPRETWLLFLIWSIIGFSIYGLYGYRNSRMRADGK